MNKILEALKTLLPADQLNEVNSAVNEMLAEAKVELEAEFNSKLEEAYSELSNELTTAEKVAVEGYQEAYAIINDLRGRLELQKEEFEQNLVSGYEEAYEMLQAEQGKNVSMENDIYSEYDQKLTEMKNHMVDKLDHFLQLRCPEIYEQAKLDILNDPTLVERKVALDKIIDIASDYLSDDYNVSGTKMEEAHKTVENLQAQVKIMEARSIRMDRDHRNLTEKFNEAVRSNEKLLTEGKKERVVKAKNVSGRGHNVVQEQVIVEDVSSDAREVHEEDATNLFKSIGLDRETANLLAGTKKQS